MSANSYILKPIIAGILATAGDRFLLGEYELMNSITFGAVTGTSIAFASLSEPGFEKLFGQEDKGFQVGKSLTARVYEVAFASGAGYLTNKYLLNNDTNYAIAPIKRLGVIAVSDIIAESVVYLMK